MPVPESIQMFNCSYIDGDEATKEKEQLSRNADYKHPAHKAEEAERVFL